jgi:uncharacterized protein
MVDIYYADTSALLKRYVQEVGSTWLIALIAPERYAMIITSKLTLAEMASAFARRRREGTITDDIHREVTQAFLDDCRTQYQLADVDDPIIDLARELLDRHPLRAYDAMHLATALIVNQFCVDTYQHSLTFLSADDSLNTAASAEGLAVDNPNNHP